MFGLIVVDETTWISSSSFSSLLSASVPSSPVIIGSSSVSMAIAGAGEFAVVSAGAGATEESESESL
jgi:hypothetical protein